MPVTWPQVLKVMGCSLQLVPEFHSSDLTRGGGRRGCKGTAGRTVSLRRRSGDYSGTGCVAVDLAENGPFVLIAPCSLQPSSVANSRYSSTPALTHLAPNPVHEDLSSACRQIAWCPDRATAEQMPAIISLQCLSHVCFPQD